MSGNYLLYFPQFCSNYSLSRICKLNQLDLSNNRFNSIFKKDLLYLTSLKTLNLENNFISSIENNSFDSLTNLETLSLALNNITNLNQDGIFKNLLNLNELNLSRNSIEILNKNLFQNLNKLLIIDLSFNKIELIRNYSFDSLFNLKSLYLNDNSDELKIASVLSLNNLQSLENIYISVSILLMSDKNKCIFRQFAEKKNLKSIRTVLKRGYFNSINLISIKSNTSLAYDCNLTLSFIKYNIHYNLKSDLDLFFYMSNNCERRLLLKIQFSEFEICQNKNKTFQDQVQTYSNIFRFEVLFAVLILFIGIIFYFIHRD